MLDRAQTKVLKHQMVVLVQLVQLHVPRFRKDRVKALERSALRAESVRML